VDDFRTIDTEVLDASLNIVHSDKLSSFLEKYGKFGAIDIHRIARYATLKSCYGIVLDLVKHEGADLEIRDTLGRSAIFYAAMCDNLDMLKYVALAVGGPQILKDFERQDRNDLFLKLDYADEKIRGEMGHQDVYGATPLHYAVKFGSFDHALFC
jgi:ankyrin repeat protein